MLTLLGSLFELHLYAIVKNDVTYHGKWGMSYEFVYSGTPAGKEQEPRFRFECFLKFVTRSDVLQSEKRSSSSASCPLQ